MDFDYLTILTLIWFIYTYLLSEADKQLLELLNRLKFVISINNKEIDLNQLHATEKFSFIEMYALQTVMKDKNHHKYINLQKALSKNNTVNIWKNILITNIFLLTLDVVINLFFNHANLEILLKLHIVISLVISICFYYFCISKIQDVMFVGSKKGV